MSEPRPIFPKIFIAAFVLFILLMVGAMVIYVVRERVVRLPVVRDVPDFTLTERSGKTVSLADLRDKIWVADFIFTHCAGPCPLMTQQMANLQKKLEHSEGVRLVSISVDPERDTPLKLTEYAERFGADKERWLFLTGEKKTIYELAEKGFLLNAGEVPLSERQPEEDYILHSTKFVLVDTAGRIRGYYDSEQGELQKKLLLDIRNLSREKFSR